MKLNDEYFKTKYAPQLDKILGEGNWEFQFEDITQGDLAEDPVYDWDFFGDKAGVGKWEMFNPKNKARIARFTLLQMANCCGICISTKASIETSFRNLGLGSLLHQLRLDIAKKAQYPLIMCTYCEDNEPQAKILKNNGWETIHSFINSRTRNAIGISIYDLTKHEMKI